MNTTRTTVMLVLFLFFNVIADSGHAQPKLQRKGVIRPLMVPIAAPGNLQVTPRTDAALDTARITWSDNSSDEDGFRVEIKAVDGSDIRSVNAEANSTSLVVSRLDPQKTYTFRVQAHRQGGFSAYSNEAVSERVHAMPAPSDLEMIPTGPREIDLKWKDNSADESWFVIRKRHGASIQEINVAANATGLPIKGLDFSRPYSFSVKACNQGGCSGFSKEVTLTRITVAGPTHGTAALAKPSFFKAEVASGSQVNLSWATYDLLNSTDGFVLERRSGGEPYSPIGRIKVLRLEPGFARFLHCDPCGQNADVTLSAWKLVTYHDRGLAGRTTYFYRLKQYNGTGESPYSTEMEVTTY